MSLRKTGAGRVIQDEESLAKEAKKDWSPEDEAELQKESDKD